MTGGQIVAAVLVAACAGGDSRAGSLAPTSFAGPTATGPTEGSTRATGPAAELLVMSYNLNYGTAGDESMIELIRTAGADLVFLQETNDAWERAIRQHLSEVYPYVAFRHSPRRAGGLGFLSRHPLRLEQYEQSPIGWFPAWRAVADTPLGRVLGISLADIEPAEYALRAPSRGSDAPGSIAPSRSEETRAPRASSSRARRPAVP